VGFFFLFPYAPHLLPGLPPCVTFISWGFIGASFFGIFFIFIFLFHLSYAAIFWCFHSLGGCVPTRLVFSLLVPVLSTVFRKRGGFKKGTSMAQLPWLPCAQRPACSFNGEFGTRVDEIDTRCLEGRNFGYIEHGTGTRGYGFRVQGPFSGSRIRLEVIST